MLTFVPDCLKTKKVCKNAVKTLPFVIKYVSDCYKTKEMCDKVILEKGSVRIYSWLLKRSKNVW